MRQRIEQVRTTCQCCNLSKTRPVLGSVSEVVEKHGYPVFFDAMTTKAGWFRSGYRGWEPLTFRIFQRFATGQIVLDVGAWVGATVIWEANVAEHVFAIEPTPVSGCQLLANLNVNPPRVSRRVTLIRGALHNETGSVVILNRKEDSNNRIYAGPARPLMTSVPSFTIEALLLKYPRLRRVSFIKIDTEGHERVLITCHAFLPQEAKTRRVGVLAPYLHRGPLSSQGRQCSERDLSIPVRLGHEDTIQHPAFHFLRQSRRPLWHGVVGYLAPSMKRLTWSCSRAPRGLFEVAFRGPPLFSEDSIESAKRSFWFFLLPCR